MSEATDDLFVLSAAQTFPGRREQCREARLWARGLVRPFTSVADAVELVLSEFFGNALRHTASGRPGGEVAVSLVGLVYGCVHLEVLDQGTPAGRPRTAARVLVPDPLCESGRGLFLAAALTREWGRLPAENGAGYTATGFTSAISPAYSPEAPPYRGPMITWADFGSAPRAAPPPLPWSGPPS